MGGDILLSFSTATHKPRVKGYLNGSMAGLRPLRAPCESRELGNGLKVVVHEDSSAPLVAVHLMYHVGSKDERPGRTGLAHLLEHLLFEGTENCPKGSFDRLLEEVGGSNNGSTWLDRTNYYETVPSHATELALWLERERMAHFLPVLDREKLELQRGVVLNERRQVIENRPYGAADEHLQLLLFGDQHPYGWPTIGWSEDLEAIELEDVRSFFSRFYTPANATLVLAGDVGAQRGFELAERYFGDLPGGIAARGTQRAHGPPRPGSRLVIEDRVSFPRLYRVYATPPYGTAEWAALDVLAYLLADGDSSRLERALVRGRRAAQDVDTYLFPTELHGVFGIVATASSGTEIERVESGLDAVLADIAAGEIEAEEVEGAVRRIRRDHVASFASVDERAEALAYAATILGEPDRLHGVLDSYLEVGVEEVVRAAREHLTAECAATLVVTPAPGGLDG
jgi:zinc protease